MRAERKNLDSKCDSRQCPGDQDVCVQVWDDKDPEPVDLLVDLSLYGLNDDRKCGWKRGCCFPCCWRLDGPMIRREELCERVAEESKREKRKMCAKLSV